MVAFHLMMRMRLDNERTVSLLTTVVMVAIGVSWFFRGFARVGLGWQIGLGGLLLFVIVDNVLAALGKERLVRRFRRKKPGRD
jgi:hypothetical protein